MDEEVWSDDDPDALGQIRREHRNIGYLQGVTKAKGESLQNGFDDGYAEGAQIGLQAGRIIGHLEGLGLSDLESKARMELQEECLFTHKYYKPNRMPKFETCHPLIVKWQKILEKARFNESRHE